MPPGLACAAIGKTVKTRITAIRLTTRAFVGMGAGLVGVGRAVANLGRQALSVSGNFRSSTGASFLQPSLASTRAVGDEGMQLFAYRLLQLMRSTSVTEFQQLEQQKTATRTN